MPNSRKRSKRRRGVVISSDGWQRVQTAQDALALAQNEGNPYTVEQLSRLTGLSANSLGGCDRAKPPLIAKLWKPILMPLA